MKLIYTNSLYYSVVLSQTAFTPDVNYDKIDERSVSEK